MIRQRCCARADGEAIFVSITHGGGLDHSARNRGKSAKLIKLTCGRGENRKRLDENSERGWKRVESETEKNSQC